MSKSHLFQVILFLLFLSIPAVFYLIREMSVDPDAKPAGISQSTDSTKIVEEETVPLEPEAVEEEQEEPLNPGQKRFTSDRLGISFVYMENQGNQNITVNESGNRVYVNYDSSDPESGQFVEVFSKDVEATLLEAIREDFLTGYSEEDCEAYTDDKGMDQYPGTYEKANIRVAPEWEDMEDFFVLYENCPFRYTQSNGISYFLGDTTHPDKYLFFSIGQYGIGADASGTKGWQDTIKFLD